MGADMSITTDPFRSVQISAYQYNMMYGKPGDNFKNPKLPSSQIQRPYRVKGTCVCLNPDGTPNKEAFQYNGGCYKCSSKRDVFYARGDVTNDTWGPSKSNQVPINLTSVGYTQYSTLDEAKQACESITSCGAILEDFDITSGRATYTLATSIQGAGSGVTTGKTGWELIRGDTQYKFNGKIEGNTLTIISSTTPLPPITGPGAQLLLTGIGVTDSTKITVGSGTTYTVSPPQSVPPTAMTAMKTSIVQTGIAKGLEVSSLPIPRAFAEDYVSPTALSRPTLTSPVSSASGNIISDVINYITNAVSVSSAFDIVAQGIENPNTYYVMDGTSRKLLGTPAPTDFGICVGPCDPQHPIHDPIQLVYDSVYSESSVQKKLFTLTGTTCSDNTKTTIDQPSIPATYIPQSGDDCDNSAASGYGGSQTNVPIYSKVDQAGSSICRAECPYGTTDNEDGTCTKTTIPRPSVQPSYSSCPPGYTKVDSLCVAPCDPGFMLDGEYCVPTTTSGLTTLSNAGSNRINCTAQPFTSTSVSVSGSTSTSGSSTATKWLCDTQADVDALLAGPSTTSGSFRTYTTPNDTICLADDPTTGMYFCQSIQEAKDAKPNYISGGMYETCDKLTKAYYDLSNNLTILAQASLNAKNTNEQLKNIQISLTNSINAMCPPSSSTSGSSTCNLLRSQLSDLQQSVATGGSRASSILNPVSLAIESRTQLVAQMDKFQCDY
jgi:hypothetical protein